MKNIARKLSALLLVFVVSAAALCPAFAATASLPSLPTQIDAASTADPEHWHPTLLALHRNCAASLDAYLARGGRSIRGWLADLDHQPVYFDQPFANANTLDDLARLAAP